jgi:crotonobetainyl-CoA:carnitine CoA-transferase CaiB-like acyl-CoA transferase
MGPLSGLRILDMTSVLMGPYATQILGDLGADIIKVEPPEGDIVRQIGACRNRNMGGMFLNTNRSKRSIVLDLKTEEGRGAFLKIAAQCDAVVYNVRPQAMERLRLSYDDVRAANPKIIYLGVFGFGQDGCYAERPAYDDLIQGATTIAAHAAESGDGTPRYVPIAMADRVVGIYATTYLLAAVHHRHRTGDGQRVDVPMFEVMTSFVMGDHMGGLTFDPPLDHGGYARLLAKHRRPYRTKDGYVCALIYNDKHWRSFFKATGREEALKDPRYNNHATRGAHIDNIYEELSAIFETRTTAEWTELLEGADIPVMPLHTRETIFSDPHLVGTDFFHVTDHPSEGRIRSMAVPGYWSSSKAEPTRHAPRLGEHTEEILREFGISILSDASQIT